MTIVRPDGQRVHIADADSTAQHWRNLHLAFPGDATIERKRLAMLCLHINGWTNERIAQAFSTSRGHVCRCLADIKRLIAEIANPPPRAA